MNVIATTFQEILFNGEAKSIILPGEKGILEILPFHKHFISRLVKGRIYIDEHIFSILRGIVKVDSNEVTIIIEKEVIAK